MWHATVVSTARLEDGISEDSDVVLGGVNGRVFTQ